MVVSVLLAVGAIAPLAVAALIVALRLRSLPRDERDAGTRHALRFGAGLALGALTALLVSAVVIGLVLALRQLLGR